MAEQNFNLYALFQEVFASRMDKPLLVLNDGGSYSYRAIDDLSARLAAVLLSTGARPGDRISAQVKKSPQALALYFACLRAGLVFHPLNPAYKAEELRYFLENAEPSVVIADSENVRTMQNLLKGVSDTPVLTLNADGSGTLMEAAEGAQPRTAIVAAEEDSMAVLLYSSGTTGQPKGIVLTHGNLAMNARTLTKAWGFTDEDVLLHALPIFHVHGLFIALGCVMFSGASMRWLDSFAPEPVLQAMPESSVFMGVPTYYTRLLAHPDFTGEGARCMRLFVSGSAPLTPETFAAFEERTGHKILERYGMTETNINTSNPLEGERRPGTVGLPLPGVEVRIVSDQNEPLPAGEVGDLQVRGENVFRAYWRQPEKTRQDFTQDGFFKTGDQATVSDDGYVSIVGRSKDMVITGGLNVYPIEVEKLLNRRADILESAVFGVPHPDFGEGLVAAIVMAEGGTFSENGIIEDLRDALAAYKIPKRIIAVDALPRNVMGKVQKNELRSRWNTLSTAG